MAKFSEIIGGITKDLVQVQISSDLSSMEAISHYQNDELLKNLDIPRFRLSNINMNMKFAIDEDVSIEHTDSSVNFVESEWKKVLYKEVIEDSFKSLPVNDKKAILTSIKTTSKGKDKSDLDFKKVLNNQNGDIVNKSTDYLLDIMKVLPNDLKNKLPKSTELKKEIKGKVEKSLSDNLSKLKKLGASKAAIERDLSVVVKKSDLESINSDQIHEISFTIEPDFIKFASED